MTTTSWDEIKRLAADFQRVQLVESSYKLSERNCIEIVNKLIELGLLNLLHSIDGKEFVTYKQIEKEIYDELYVHEGRINIVELQAILNIDVSHIEAKVSEIVKQDPNLHFILGQVISKDYMNKMAEEVNDLLQDRESLELSELTSLYELPGEFVQQIIKPRMGTIIKGNFDGKIMYTHNYVNRQRSHLIGVLEASIKPIRFSQIVKEFNLDVDLIFELFDELVASGQVKGGLFGGRQVMSAVFVPAIFTKAQQQYVSSFFKQNGYIEYSSLKKIGISEPDSYVKSQLTGQEIKYLSSSCFGSFFLDQIEQEIDDVLNRNELCDISQLVPSVLNAKDIIALTAHFETKIKPTFETVIMCETYLVNKTFLKTLQARFQVKMEEKSQEDLRKRNYVLAFRTEHAVCGGYSSGSSTTTSSSVTGKTGKTGKSKKAAAVETVDENMIEITFIDKASLIRELKVMIKEVNDDLVDALVEYYLKLLNIQYFEMLKNKVESGKINLNSSEEVIERTATGQADQGVTVGARSPSKKITIKDLQEKVRLFLVNAKIFEKSMKLFTDNKVQDLLSKHLIKTVCSEVANEMVRLIAEEQMIQCGDDLNTDSRAKVIQKFKEPHKKGFTELNQSMTNKTFTEVIEHIERVATESFEMSMQKKADLKREKELVLQLRESTKASLEAESDAATVLHLACTLLFYHSTGLILNSPGRCVPNILEHLREDVLEEAYNKLVYFQNLIIENAKADGQKTPIDAELVNEIKSIGLDDKSFLKSSKSKA